MTAEFTSAPRIHTALTADLEKRILVWMARRAPAIVGPDHLTALAFLAQLAAGAAYALSGRDPRVLWLASIFLVLNWLGDSLDGTLARVRNRQRPRYGFYVDHIADTFGALAMIGGLACSGYVHLPIAAGLLAGYYILAIESYLATYTLGRFHLSHGLFGPTEIRIFLIIGNAALFFHPYATLAGRRFLLFDCGGVIAVAGMAVMAIAAAVRNAGTLYRQERY